MHDLAESADPTTRVCACSSDRPKTDNGEGPSVASGRVRRIRKRLHPRFDGECARVELDTDEEVHSGPRNPRLGDNGARPQCGWLVMKVVDDDVKYLSREGERHRGLCRDSEVPVQVFDENRSSTQRQLPR